MRRFGQTHVTHQQVKMPRNLVLNRSSEPDRSSPGFKTFSKCSTSLFKGPRKRDDSILENRAQLNAKDVMKTLIISLASSYFDTF